MNFYVENLSLVLFPLSGTGTGLASDENQKLRVENQGPSLQHRTAVQNADLKIGPIFVSK